MRIPWKKHLQALQDTQSWCALHFDPAQLQWPAPESLVDAPYHRFTIFSSVLRSEALQLNGVYESWCCWDWDVQDIENLIQKRHELLPEHTPPLTNGRILCVGEDLDTFMGEGVPASYGVIDEYYMPPWDTWFACLQDPEGKEKVLLAWIPHPLIELVQSALEIAATQPLMWLDSLQFDEWRGSPAQKWLVKEAHAVLISGSIN